MTISQKVVALLQAIHQSDVTLGTMPPKTPVVTLMIGTHVLVSNCISASSVHDHLESLTPMPDHKKFKPEVLSVQITHAAFESLPYGHAATRTSTSSFLQYPICM